MAESQGLDPRHDPIYQRGYDPAVHGDAAPAEGTAPSRRSRVRRSSDEELFAPPRSSDPRASRGSNASTGGETHGEQPLIHTPEWSPFAVFERDGRAESRDERTEVRDASTMREPDAEPGVRVDGGAAAANVRPGPPSVSAPPVPPWRNPYLIGLVAGGAVLALVGFQMFRSALETIYVDFAQSGMIFGGDESSGETPDPVAELVSMQIGWSLGPVLFLLGIAAILAVLVFVAVRWRPAPSAGEPGPRGSGADGRESPASRP